MDAEDLCETLLAYKARRDEEKLFLRWVVTNGVLEGITGSSVSLQEYKAHLRPVDNRSAAAIIHEVNGFIETFNEAGAKRVEVFDGII